MIYQSNHYSPSSHSYLTFRSGHHHTYTHLSRTHAWIHLCHRPSLRCRRRNRSLMTQPALSRRVGVIYAALDEAVSFVPISIPLSCSLSHDRHPATQLTPSPLSRRSRSLGESPTQRPDVAYAAGGGRLRRALVSHAAPRCRQPVYM